jgi:hypothetical protein
MKLGVVQPYFLPYIGYFALINAVDRFVYFDDVQYIRRGWVNRNRIKMGTGWQYITLPVGRASQSARINEVCVIDDEREIQRLKKAIQFSYERSPYYDTIVKMLFDLIKPGENIAATDIALTNSICQYLGFSTEFYVSSEIAKDDSLRSGAKIIEICKILGGDHYVNPIGGLELYSREMFLESGLKLSFLKMNEVSYSQGKGEFIPSLSILDVLMWNSKEEVVRMLAQYEMIEGTK